MGRIFCPECGLEQPDRHNFCLRCGGRIPTHLLEREPSKSARFFAGVKVSDGDPEHGFLKVSCYRTSHHLESGDASMSVPSEHVRFSMWVDNEARCVLSLPISEARALAEYLGAELPRETTVPSPLVP